jgi:hypothetical protein
MGLSQPLVEELPESPLFISMWRAFDKQILESLQTLRELHILVLSKRIDFLMGLIYAGHWEKIGVELTQQALPRGNRARCIGIQPRRGSIMKRKRKSIRWTNSSEKFWNLVVAHIFLNFFP